MSTTIEVHGPKRKANITIIDAASVDEAVDKVRTEYVNNEVCMGELLDAIEIHGLSIGDILIVYARLMSYAEGDVLITVKEGEAKTIR